MTKNNNKPLVSRASEVHHVKKMLKNVPDMRNDKVQTLKSGINEGSYKVKVEKVAEKIIERTLKTAISKKRDA